ncbi:4332_t:CDS:2, partial [Racocetra persica]
MPRRSLSENVHRARRNSNNALYEALGVVQDENSCLFRLVASQRIRIQSLETELVELRTNAVSRVQDGWMLKQQYTRLLEERNRLRARLANDEKELRRLRAEERRRERNNNNRDRMSDF